MAEKKLADLSDQMRKIDIAMLSTHSKGGNIAGRPMSNNGQVEYDGTSYYFTYEAAHTVGEIEADPKVSLAFMGQKGFSVAVEGKATLSRDRAKMQQHWSPDLDKWFKNGIDTPDIVMIQVDATRVHYWDGEDEGEIKL
ncbi:pyridoxamine 5'-phosphate oxidase [Deinococcus aerolatus]|uniref:Pyridoxamine 5'-phosphate oxidase n=1 Tax=Deinococcus aerolatus TaxID=522487 RepID=A0ABQ2G6Z1_9DEIO|nr:pyridoxamine 5'-phosphate oxidase family protein [Deinococcus aerolatus]GGL77240.1 pyridoxamine 5'-phosphate oxidase [Deinococcus aerolatus]